MGRARRWLPMALLAVGALAGGPGSAAPAPQAGDLAQFVDPFIGTAPAPSAHYGFEFDGGDVFPGATYPLGMLYWSPDTAEHSIAGGYWYPDTSIKGFSLTHFSGRGCTVYLDVPLMPLNGRADRPAPATFAHQNEQAEPGYYRVRLDTGIDVQLTTTPRTGLAQFTFPEPDSSITIDLGGSVNGVFDSQITIDPDQRLITGSVTSQVGCGTDRYTLYFVVEFDQPFVSSGTSGRVAYVSFAGTSLLAKAAISYVSVDGARRNLRAENATWDFAALRQQARDAWNDVLDKVQLTGGSREERTVFYTALYHAFLHPNLFSDADGSYLGFDDRVHQVDVGHAHYHNIPGWDQYRALIQLRAMLDPERTSDIVQSLVRDAEQSGGAMPRWEQANRNSNGMVGDSPGAYVANAFAFGARAFDTEAAWRAVDLAGSVAGTTSGGHPAREYLEGWLRLGYVPDQPSITLEYATDDFAIGQFARALHKDELATRYEARARQWRNATGTTYVEGSAEQYAWMVPFDISGVAESMGGRAAALARLDEHVTELNAGPNSAHLWMGNEPGLTTPWAYNALGAPARTQALVRRIQDELFTTGPGGLPGNDDGGTLSAWYVLSALGLFPATPGSDELQIGSPRFTQAVLRVGDAQTVTISASGTGPYVSGVRLNGHTVLGTSVRWGQLSGSVLEFDLTVDEPVLAERHQE